MAQRIEDALLRLQSSNFRARFHLSEKDRQYIDEKGLDTIRKHAEDFVSKRLAPDVIENDGKQTPMRGHPVFVAQHATATCCRGCFCIQEEKSSYLERCSYRFRSGCLPGW